MHARLEGCLQTIHIRKRDFSNRSHGRWQGFTGLPVEFSWHLLLADHYSLAQTKWRQEHAGILGASPA